MLHPPRWIAAFLAASLTVGPVAAQVAAVPVSAAAGQAAAAAVVVPAVVPAAAGDLSSVAQNARKMMLSLEGAAIAAPAAAAVKPVPGVVAKPTVPPAEYGRVTSYVGQRLGISGEQAAKATTYLKSSPLFEQFKRPLQPANIGLAVGMTAAVNLYGQLKDGEQLDVAKATEFVKDKSFWGGVVGSGVGYATVAAVATKFFPVGVGAIPALGMIFPMFAGLAGGLVGWELGAGLLKGKPLNEILGGLDITGLLGNAAGSTAGLLVGAKAGAAVGGALGSLLGPAGAIAGAMILGPIGAKLAGSVKTMLFGGGDPAAQAAAKKDAGALLGKIEHLEKAVSGIGLPAGMASAESGSEAGEIKAEYEAAHEALRQSLITQDRDGAFVHLKAMQAAALRYRSVLER